MPQHGDASLADQRRLDPIFVDGVQYGGTDLERDDEECSDLGVDEAWYLAGFYRFPDVTLEFFPIVVLGPRNTGPQFPVRHDCLTKQSHHRRWDERIPFERGNSRFDATDHGLDATCAIDRRYEYIVNENVPDVARQDIHQPALGAESFANHSAAESGTLADLRRSRLGYPFLRD